MLLPAGRHCTVAADTGLPAPIPPRALLNLAKHGIKLGPGVDTHQNEVAGPVPAANLKLYDFAS